MKIIFRKTGGDKITNVKVDVYLLAWRIAEEGRHEEIVIRYLFGNRTTWPFSLISFDKSENCFIN